MNMQIQSIPKDVKLYSNHTTTKMTYWAKRASYPINKIKPHQDLTTNILSCNLKLKLCERNFE